MAPEYLSPCQICETRRDVRIILRLQRCTIAKCRGCGFVYVNGPRVPGIEQRKYEIDSFEGAGYLTSLDVERICREQLRSVRFILRKARAPLESQDPDLPTLDVGCARGHFLHHFSKETGRNPVMGIDTSRKMTDWGRDHLGLDLRRGAIEEVELPREFFGLITMFDVLEHTAQPREVLARIMSLLKGDGWAILEVPSEVTAFRKLTRLGHRLSGGRFVDAVEALYHRNHLSYFSPRSLHSLISRVGGTGVTIASKEAHVTRFGSQRYSVPVRMAMRTVALLDRALGTEAKLLCAFKKPPSG